MRCKPPGAGTDQVRADRISVLNASGGLAGSDVEAMMNQMNITDFSAELPDELALLAEQLGYDADLLAETYPARAPQFVPAISISSDTLGNPATAGNPAAAEPIAADRLLTPMPVWMRWTAAAAVLVCAVWGTLGGEANAPIHEFGTPRGNIVEHSPRSSGPTPVSIEPSPVSRDLYENLTAPAREALLDMWEAESAPQASLSI
jgi:hypothetical protein